MNILTHFKEIFEQSYPGQWSELQKIGKKIQNIIQYDFENEETLWIAMSIRGSKLATRRFERLEFLGDSILKAIHGILLFERGDEFQPGKLSAFRRNLESNENLALLAEELKFNEIGLLLGIGELSSNQAAEFFEALIGAIFIDKKSLDDMTDLVKGITHFEKKFKELRKAPRDSKDSKSILNEWILNKYSGEASIAYEIKNEGSIHAPQFKARAIIKKKFTNKSEFEGSWVGTFSKKKDVEKEAAKRLLLQLEEEEGKLDRSS